jgi:hypothetical protein
MSELQEFIKKRTASFSGISSRKLYGLEAFYLGEKPYIIISANDEVIVKVDDLETKKELKKHQVTTEWTLDDKAMASWFLIPTKFNNKKNKIVPILEITSKILLQPKKKKSKNNKVKKAKKIANAAPKKKQVIKASFFQRLIQKFK